jgi:putative transposase
MGHFGNSMSLHLRKNLGEVFHDLARQKESKLLEEHLQQERVHVLILIPPKYAVVQVVT